MDLFTPVVGEEAQHPYFQSILKQANGFNCEVLNEWARGFKDWDGKFVKEFQTTFDSSFWELYLFAVMKQFHLDVAPKNRARTSCKQLESLRRRAGRLRAK
jgi:AAA+ superfamily predicted ATPase